MGQSVYHILELIVAYADFGGIASHSQKRNRVFGLVMLRQILLLQHTSAL